MLRIACAAEFVGHGAFGVMTKAAWLPYFGVAGIPPELAWKLMPLIGTVDITLGLLVGLVRPARVLLLYMAFWGLLTATIRPLAGEPIWEFVERVPNWAVPLAFFGVRSLGQPRPEWPSQLNLLRGRCAGGVAAAASRSWCTGRARRLRSHSGQGQLVRLFRRPGSVANTVESRGLLSIVGGARSRWG